MTIDVKCVKVGPSSHKLSVNVGMSCFFSNERFIYKFYFSDGTSFARVVEFPAFEYTSTALLRHLESLEVGIFTGEFVEPWWSDKIAIDCAP